MSDILIDIICGIIEVAGDMISESSKRKYRPNRRSSSNYPRTSKFNNTPTFNNYEDKPRESCLNVDRKRVYDTGKYLREQEALNKVNEEPTTIPKEKINVVHKEEPVIIEKADSFDEVSISSLVESPTLDFDTVSEIKEEELKEDTVVVEKPVRDNIVLLKCEILILSYLYTEDDGRISYSEKTKLQRHFKSYKGKLNSDDVISLKELMEIEPSLENIRAHISQNEMNDEEVDTVISFIKKYIGINKDYNKILSRVDASIKNEINF